MTRKRRGAWRVWVKALGEKASKCDNESDRVALIRTLIFATYLTTNLFIVAGVVRHWDDGQSSPPSNWPTTPSQGQPNCDMIVK
jgi:hypothetical protein